MAWTLTTSLAALRRDLNSAFPNRDKASDGTIGDAAHQASVSGHNPDDTAGSKSEYSDADAKQEVRAYDADNDLRDPRGVDFQQVIDAILATPADRVRLAYIIHRRKIWRKRNGWRRESYTGSSPHDEHGHFSGDPAFDEDASPWTSILRFKEAPVADTTPTETNDWTGLRRIESLHKNLSHTVVDATGGGEPNGLHTKLEEILTAVLQPPAAVDATAVAAALAADQSFIGALAVAVAEELADPAAQKQIAKDGALAAAKVIAAAVAGI